MGSLEAVIQASTAVDADGRGNGHGLEISPTVHEG